MRRRFFNTHAIAWALGLGLVTAAGVGAALRIDRDSQDRLVHPLSLFPANDPLGATLDRCAALLRRHEADPACDAAWAEIRRRFFGPDGSAPASPTGIKDGAAVRSVAP